MAKSIHRYTGISITYLVTFFLLTNFSVQAQVRVGRNLGLQSKILDQKISYSVILPSTYHLSSERYPVIYLLHGFGGNHESWLDRCKIDHLVDSLIKEGDIGEFIYIIPDAKNSYYINNYDSSFLYHDFFVKELVPTIDSLFRTRKQREFRALMGLSMGGFGSIILAVENPELFGSVVAMSPAIRNQDIFKALPHDTYDRFFGSVYGSGLEGDERITRHWMENSPFVLIDSTTARNYLGINWYIDCGLYDPLLPASEAFHQLLLKYQIPHELHIRPGGHNWEYWYHSTVSGLIYLSNKLMPPFNHAQNYGDQ